MPVAMNRRRVSNFTYVSPCVKYMIFLLNFLFWVCINLYGLIKYNENY